MLMAMQMTLVVLIGTFATTPLLPFVLIVLVLELLVVVGLVLTPSTVVFVARMVVLEAELVAVRQATVDAEDAFDHAHARLASEVAPINMKNLPLFNFLGRQDGVLEKTCLVLCIDWVQIADGGDNVFLGHHFNFIIICLAGDFLSKWLRLSLREREASSMDLVFLAKLESVSLCS